MLVWLKRESVLQMRKNKKKTQYVLRDYMFKFWYEFIPKATSVIEMGQGEIYYQDTQSGLKQLSEEDVLLFTLDSLYEIKIILNHV